MIFLSYNRNAELKGVINNYYLHYVPCEMLKKARDKISDYEWIFRHIVKVENIDLMRQNWCGR